MNTSIVCKTKAIKGVSLAPKVFIALIPFILEFELLGFVGPMQINGPLRCAQEHMR